MSDVTSSANSASTEDADDDPRTPPRSAKQVDKAVEAYENGRPEDARRYAHKALDAGELAALDGARLAELFKVLGDEAMAEQVTTATLQGIEIAMREYPDSAGIQFDCGHVLSQMGYSDRALAPLRRALELNREDFRPAFPQLTILLGQGKPDEVMELWLPSLEAYHGKTDAAGNTSDLFWTCLARGFAHLGFREHALRAVALAEPKWTGDLKAFEKHRRGIEARDHNETPLEEAIAGFDSFSNIY